MTKVKQRRESKPHPAPFIGNRGPTPVAADLAGQDAFIPVLLTIEKTQIFQSGSEPHLMFVKDGSPLHRSAMQCLACSTMTEFGLHRFSAHLVSNAATKAGGLVFWNKCRIL
jgi:hypothetical protein